MKPNGYREGGTRRLAAISAGFAGGALFILLLSMCFQKIILIDIGPVAIKPFHVIAIVVLFISMAIKRTEWRLPGVWFSMAFLLLCIISLFDSFRFGISPVLFNYAFFYVVVAAVYNMGFDLSMFQWKALVRRVALLLLLFFYVHIAANYRIMLDFFSNPWSGHPLIDSIFGGGVNLDASWLALFGVFFDRDVKGNVFLLGSLGVSAMYASRAGMLLSLLPIVYVYMIKPQNWGALKRVAIAIVLAFVLVVLSAQFGGVIVDRFLSIGDESGSQGRLDMWRFALPAFADAPFFGAGAGNAILHVETISGVLFSEGNVHNYFLQVLLDFGLIGFVAFSLLVAYVIKSGKKGLQNPFTAYILCWLVGSFMQFRGADAMLGFFVAGWLLTWKVLSRDTKHESVEREKRLNGIVPKRPSTLFICNMYFQLVIAAQLMLTSFLKHRVGVWLMDPSGNAKDIAFRFRYPSLEAVDCLLQKRKGCGVSWDF